MIGRPSLQTITAAAERAEAAARAIAAKLSGLHSELDQYIETVIGDAVQTAKLAETAVLTEAGRRRSEETMRALEARVLEAAREMPMQDRMAFITAELQRSVSQ